MTKNRYEEAAKTKLSRGGNYVRGGHYIVLVDAAVESENRKHIANNAVEMTVLHVFPDSVQSFDYDKKEKQPLHIVGEQISDVISSANEMAGQRIKRFVMAAGNLTEEQCGAAEMQDAFSADQPLAGFVLEMRPEQQLNKVGKAKPTESLTSKDGYIVSNYMRRVPFAEVKQILPAAVVTRFLPDIDEEIAADAAEAAEEAAEAAKQKS